MHHTVLYVMNKELLVCLECFFKYYSPILCCFTTTAAAPAPVVGVANVPKTYFCHMMNKLHEQGGLFHPIAAGWTKCQVAWGEGREGMGEVFQGRERTEWGRNGPRRWMLGLYFCSVNFCSVCLCFFISAPEGQGVACIIWLPWVSRPGSPKATGY